MKRRVYVIGSYISAGGAYMAYSVGEIFHKHFDFESIAVQVGNETIDSSVFDYEREARQVSLETMLSEIQAQDVLLCNPSFSNLGLGCRVAATKVMYAQGFNTFQLIDGFFDHYISVSGYVSDFLRNVYAIESPVIPAFAETASISPAASWDKRSANVVLLSNKGQHHLDRAIEGTVVKQLQHEFPDLVFEPLLPGRQIRHADLLARLSSARYFMTLSCSEGFGLLPLEAMSLGVSVIGWDGFGGRQFMKPGWNCEVARYPKLQDLLRGARRILSDSRHAQHIAANGTTTAQNFTRQQFEESWASVIANTILRGPVA